ncbi:hypothetical protein NRO40_30020 [Streptomyces changanensis]|uniref:Uncharacterized protein n=1 Tax=Streptomyces changanensis TaxID=2964669 RepID=A0ABY5NEY0_9ACTN|nr:MULTISPECIES: hypothetical protein [Streptomyces]UUS34628.1 hypothetical protein NRO40_30020 [Streptomyces changanensis]
MRNGIENERAVGAWCQLGAEDQLLSSGDPYPVLQLGFVSRVGVACGREQLKALLLEVGVPVGMLCEQRGSRGGLPPDQGLARPSASGDQLSQRSLCSPRSLSSRCVQLQAVAAEAASRSDLITGTPSATL